MTRATMPSNPDICPKCERPFVDERNPSRECTCTPEMLIDPLRQRVDKKFGELQRRLTPQGTPMVTTPKKDAGNG